MSTKKLQIVGSLLEVDSTLAQSGQAADAKATGDAINLVQANVDRISDMIGESSVSEQIQAATVNKAEVGHKHDDIYYTEAEIDELLYAKADSDVVSANYDESIIGLSIDGQVITYIKGDGSQHTIVTQDTDTTYTLGTDTTTGLTKLYAVTGSAEDGTMTQKAIKTELDKKVGVTIDDTNDMLIFTI